VSGTLVLLDGDAAVGGREGLGVERGGREQGGAGDEGVGAQWVSHSVVGGDTCGRGIVVPWVLGLATVPPTYFSFLERVP